MLLRLLKSRMYNKPLRILLFLLFISFLTMTILAQSDDSVTVFPVPLMSAYLPNPGIGWQHAPGIGEQLLPETVVYPQRSDLSWQILNPEEDVYEWHILDEMIAAAAAEGKQFSFRAYTMRGEDFGGHQIPQWVLDAGAEITPVGEPDYSNCTYQAEWARFVTALVERYDGHPTIAFIDISGYGDFNEWSWRDEQTEWDDLWWEAYTEGYASPETMTVLDSQARRRLADMFIGGRFDNHQCRTAYVDGEVLTVSYDYVGFQQTQLVMPYAGVRQSTQYVFVQRPDVGFRYDCLGREESDIEIIEELGTEIEGIWRNAPVVFELCGDLDDNFVRTADALLQAAHGSIVHDNLDDEEYRDKRAVGQLMRYAGYRYFMSQATYSANITGGESLAVDMLWQNVGYAPSYPRMGQDFQLRLYLVDDNNAIIVEASVAENIAGWMPADIIGEPPPEYAVSGQLPTADIPAGTYQMQIAIVNQRTGEPLRLALVGQNRNGRFTLGSVEVD